MFHPGDRGRPTAPPSRPGKEGTRRARVATIGWTGAAGLNRLPRGYHITMAQGAWLAVASFGLLARCAHGFAKGPY